MNKKIKICFGLITMTVASLSALLIGTKVNGSESKFKLDADSDYTWEHYNAVSPTFESSGSKEYWISCDDSTHTPNLTQPSSGTINPAKDPASGFAASLESSDSRYVEKFRKALSFEDGMPSFIKVGGSQTNSITTEQHTDGEKCLKLELTGSATVAMNRDLLNAMFNLDGVSALLFDVKCLNTPDYTKATLMYMRSASDKYGVRRFDDSYANKGVTVRGDGIRTYWKTFMINSTMFADLNADNVIMRFDNMSGNTVYIDNIRVGVDRSNNPDVITFDDASIHNTSGNKWEVLNLYKNYLEDTWPADFMIYSNNTVTASFSDTYSSDGGASLHVVSSGLVRFGVSSALYSSMGANDYIEYDYFVDPEGSNQHLYTSAWGTYIGTPNNWSNIGKWIRMKITKSQLATNSDLNSSYYCILTASGPTNAYIDNVRVIRPASYAIDFEYGTVSTFASSYYGYTSNYDDKYFNVDYETYNATDFFYQGNFKVSLSDEHSVGGARSLKAEATAANSGLYISEKLYNLLGDEGLSFDMYVTQAVNFNTIQGTNPGLHHWSPGTWQKITVPKANMKSMTYGYILFTYAGVTTSYIDNVRIEPAATKMNSELLNQSSYNWYE